MEDDVATARHWFAEDLRVVARLRTRAIVDAFARVPRERFIGPPPWRVGTRLMPAGALNPEFQSCDGDASVLYHDVIVALNEEQEINNGQPSLWGRLFEESQPRTGERVLHLGCGSGYYTAILAEIVGVGGLVHGIEVEPGLAKRAKDALDSRPNVSVACGDGATAPPQPWDLIVVSAGVTHPLQSWLGGLSPNGRLLFPLTADSPNPRSGNGAMLLISRCGNGPFGARFLTPASFVHFQGGRNPDASARFLQALRLRFQKMSDVHSLRQDTHEESESCWLHTDAFCLSYREPG